MTGEIPDEAVALTSDELWRIHYRPLREFCAAIGGPGDADDLATDTFLRCRERLESGQIRNPRAYLRRSAVNGAQNLRRSRERSRRRDTELATPSAGSDCPELGHVRDAIRSLSPRQRAVLFLAYWEDQTETSIANTLGIHVGTVRRHLHRAHLKLRKALQ